MDDNCVLKNKIYRLLLFLIMMYFLLKLQCSLSVRHIIRSDRALHVLNIRKRWTESSESDSMSQQEVVQKLLLVYVLKTCSCFYKNNSLKKHRWMKICVNLSFFL